VLKICIPGCEELNKDSDTELSAKVTTKVGPVSAKFTGKVTLSEINPPEGYKITGEGQGGVAGFAKGGAEVKLKEDGNETILSYTATAQVGGKLAQIGSRLIDSTAKKMAGQFFGKFAEEIGETSAAATETSVNETAASLTGDGTATVETPKETGGINPTVWIGGLIAAVVVILIILN
jgi:hypothetical protein